MTTRATTRRDLRILGVDDEPLVLTLTVHVLQQLGFGHITTAADGAAAIQVMQTANPSLELVICDLNMPVMDGYEFLRTASALGYQGAIILLSSETPDALTEALALGHECGLNILGALRKPLEPGLLMQILDQHKAFQ